MKTLYLVRHAKSSWDDHSIPDVDRPLNKRGLRDAPFMGNLLEGMGEIPEIIVTSPAKRAMATARLFAEAFDLPGSAVVEAKPLYAASAQTILRLIGGLDAAVTRAMVVGHNPGMTEAAGDLSPDAPAHMPTCSIAAIEFPVDSWPSVRSGKGKLKFFETPKKHRR